LTPIGNTVPEYWTSLLAGVSGAGPITRFDVSKFQHQDLPARSKTLIPGAVYRTAKKPSVIDRFTHNMPWPLSAEEAVKDAGFAFTKK
jgi:3-oxoacyl-[acyl-carrier-protein] synthase II